MPFYSFKCTSPTCGAEDDRKLPINHTIEDLKEVVCPVCDSLMTKQLTAPAVHFHGMDWYKPSASQPKLEKQTKKGG